MSTKDIFSANIMSNPMVGGVTAATTTSTGLMSFYEWLPPLLGIVGTSVGIVLSIVMIYTTIRRHIWEMKKIKLETKRLTL